MSRDPSPAEVAEIARLHDEVVEASEDSSRSPFGGKGRKRLKAAQQAEHDVLAIMGFASYDEFVAETQGGAAPPAPAPPADEGWAVTKSAAPEAPTAPAPAASTPAPPTPVPPTPVPPSPAPPAPPAVAPSKAPRASSFATLADLNASIQAITPPPIEPAVEAPSEMEAEIAPDATPDVAPDPASDVAAELEATRAELGDTRRQLQRLQGELVGAQSARVDAETARRQLTDAETELERVRGELASVTTARFSDEAALERIRAESERELEKMRSLAGAEVQELAAQLTAFQEETARAAEVSARNHREELERAEADLQAARGLVEQGASEITDANALTRRRDRRARRSTAPRSTS